MADIFPCDECGGSGMDPGSLREPEPCTVCQGLRFVLVDTDMRSSDYGRRRQCTGDRLVLGYSQEEMERSA